MHRESGRRQQQEGARNIQGRRKTVSKKWGQWNAVRKLMERGLTWEDEWEEVEGLVVGKQGTQIVAEQ